MKKSSIWKLLFSALTVFAVAVFAGCTDDNDDMGAPYLNVTPENLTFDAEGQPADEYNGTFIVETNRPWRAIVEDEQTWVRLSATEGEGDAAVTVTVPASNIGQSAKVTFEVYNSYGALIQKDVNVLQGEVKPATVIYGNNFDKTLAAKDANNRWPFLDQSDAWQNATGTGIESVTYAYGLIFLMRPVFYSLCGCDSARIVREGAASGLMRRKFQGRAVRGSRSA